MKTRIGSLLLSLVCAVLLMISSAQAALIQAGSTDWYYNDTTDLYWYYDVASFADKTYSEAEAFVGGLAVDGARLATKTEALALLGDTADRQLVGQNFTNTTPNWIIGRTSTVYPSPGYHWYVQTYFNPAWVDGTQWTPPTSAAATDSGSDVGAWVVTATDPTAVPEPASLILVGSGLAGLLGISRKREK